MAEGNAKESVACQIMMFRAFIEFALSPCHQFVFLFFLSSFLRLFADFHAASLLWRSFLLRPRSFLRLRLLFVVTFVQKDFACFVHCSLAVVHSAKHRHAIAAINGRKVRQSI